jgi:hypothetical protein
MKLHWSLDSKSKVDTGYTQLAGIAIAQVVRCSFVSVAWVHLQTELYLDGLNGIGQFLHQILHFPLLVFIPPVFCLLVPLKCVIRSDHQPLSWLLSKLFLLKTFYSNETTFSHILCKCIEYLNIDVGLCHMGEHFIFISCKYNYDKKINNEIFKQFFG